MDLCIFSLKPSVSGWKAVDKECLQPKALIKLHQKRDVRHGSQSDTIEAGIWIIYQLLYKSHNDRDQ